jgi:hypothetical protein
MNKRDDDPAPEAVPPGQGVPRAVGDELRRYYKTLVDQELPDKISALYQRFDELTKEKSGPETQAPQGPAATKKPPE